MKKVTIVIVDDHSVVRDGIKSLLSETENINVVGEAANGEEALLLVKKHSPDILLADISMPGQSGLDLTEIVTKKYPDTKVIIFSMHEDEEYITKSIEFRASGYLSKDVEKDEILLAITTVMKGGQYYSSNVSQRMLDSFAKQNQQIARHDEETVHLTLREKEVLNLVATGLSSKDVAEKLFISKRTVETHRNNIMQKLEVKNSAELIKYSIEHNLITIES